MTIAPNDLQLLMMLRAWLEQSFKGATVGQYNVDEMREALARVVIELEKDRSF